MNGRLYRGKCHSVVYSPKGHVEYILILLIYVMIYMKKDYLNLYKVQEFNVNLKYM